MRKRRAYFVAGTDTEVGKTFIACGLLEAARLSGLSTLAVKPLAAGCEAAPDGLRNADALALMQHCSVPASYDEINPVALKQAAAPHIAAEQEQRRLSVDRLSGFCRAALSKKADFTIIEGAGGWMVPLNPREYLSALPRELDLPVILVVGIRLGCLNHALLTARAIAGDGLRLAGWVANMLEPDMPYATENIAALEQRLDAPRVGTVSYHSESKPGAELNSASCANELDLARLFC